MQEEKKKMEGDTPKLPDKQKYQGRKRKAAKGPKVPRKESLKIELVNEGSTIKEEEILKDNEGPKEEPKILEPESEVQVDHPKAISEKSAKSKNSSVKNNDQEAKSDRKSSEDTKLDHKR